MMFITTLTQVKHWNLLLSKFPSAIFVLKERSLGREVDRVIGLVFFHMFPH